MRPSARGGKRKEGCWGHVGGRRGTGWSPDAELKAARAKRQPFAQRTKLLDRQGDRRLAGLSAGALDTPAAAGDQRAEGDTTDHWPVWARMATAAPVPAPAKPSQPPRRQLAAAGTKSYSVVRAIVARSGAVSRGSGRCTAPGEPAACPLKATLLAPLILAADALRTPPRRRAFGRSRRSSTRSSCARWRRSRARWRRRRCRRTCVRKRWAPCPPSRAPPPLASRAQALLCDPDSQANRPQPPVHRAAPRSPTSRRQQQQQQPALTPAPAAATPAATRPRPAPAAPAAPATRARLRTPCCTTRTSS